MFNLIKTQIKIYSMFALSNFSGKGETASSTPSFDIDNFATNINNGTFDIYNPQNREKIREFLKEVAKNNKKEGKEEKILPDQIGGLLSNMGYALKQITYLKPDDQSDVDFLNGFSVIKPSEVTKQVLSKSFSDITKGFKNSLKPFKEKVKRGEKLTPEELSKVKEAIVLAQSQVKEITKAGLNNERERAEVIQEIKKAETELLNSFGTTKTQEQVSKYDSKFLGYEVATGTSRAETIKSLSATSKSSLQNILKSSNLSQIALELKDKAPKEDGKVVFRSYFAGSSNAGDFKDAMDKIGYKFDGMTFDSDEMAAVYQTIQDYAYNQENLPKSPEEQFKLLIDFDRDGNLGTDVNFSVGESQFYYSTFKALSSDGIDAVMKNLGFISMKSFSGDMSKNFFSARERFQRVLGAFIERGVKPGDLVKKGGVDKYFKNLQKFQDDVAMTVENELDRNKLLEQKLSNITDLKQREEAKNKIKLAAIGLMVGSKYGVGASFDVKEFTNHFIDAVQVGMVGLIPVVGVSKNIFSSWDKSDNFNLSTIGPSVDATKVFKISENNGLAVSGAVSIIGGVGTLGYEDISVDTSTGIEKEMSYMQEDLKKLKEAILAGDKSEIKFKNQGLMESLYVDFKEAVSLYATKGKEGDFLDGLITAFLTSYKNELYNNAKGFKFTSAGVGVIVPFFHSVLIPFVYAGGEYISQKYSKFNHRINEERETTKTETQFKKLGIEKVEYKGFNVYRIPEAESIYDISSSNVDVQAEREGGYLYFSGDIKNIGMEESTTNTGVKKTIIINGGKTDSEGNLIPAIFNNISSSVKGFEKITKVTSSPERVIVTKEAVEATSFSRENIFNILGTDALTSRNTPGMKNLQKMAFDFANGVGNLSDVWEQFLTVFVKNDKIDKYASSNGSLEDLKALRDFIKIGGLTDAEKYLLIQSVPNSLMKKTKLKNVNGTVNIGESISNYDKKRSKLFDDIFKKAGFSQELVGKIQGARSEWHKINGNEKTYKPTDIYPTNEIGESTAFSAIKSGKNMGTMPLVGAYSIAGVKENTIPISGKYPEVIDNLPNNYLSSIKDFLNNTGANLKDINDVKSFINNGGNNSLRLDYKLSYTKMGECINDAVVVSDIILTKNTQSGESIDIPVYTTQTNEVYVAENDVDKYGIIVTGEKQKIKIGGDKDDSKGGGNGPNSTSGDGGNNSNVNNSGGGNIDPNPNPNTNPNPNPNN